MLRSIASARRFASAAVPLPAFAAPPRLAALVARRTAPLATRLGEDINVVSLADDLILFQFQPAIARAFPGFDIVFHAMPGTDEVHFALGEIESHRGLVRTQALFDFGDGQALASGAALVETEIRVGEKLALMEEYADLVVADKNDAALSV